MANKYIKSCSQSFASKMQNQNHNEMLLHTPWGGYRQRRIVASAGEDCGESECSHTAGGKARWCSRSEDRLAGPPTLKHGHVIRATVPHPHVHPRESKTYVPTKTSTQVFIAAFIHNSQKVEATQMSINRKWILRMWSIQTTGSYWATEGMRSW